MRQELKQAAAAAHRKRPRPAAASRSRETERILLRALVLPDSDPARQLAASRLAEHPEWYDGLAAAALLEILANADPPAQPARRRARR